MFYLEKMATFCSGLRNKKFLFRDIQGSVVILGGLTRVNPPRITTEPDFFNTFIYNKKREIKTDFPLFNCDPGAIQTHDLQNRNLTLYSLSYGANLVMQI